MCTLWNQIKLSVSQKNCAKPCGPESANDIENFSKYTASRSWTCIFWNNCEAGSNYSLVKRRGLVKKPDMCFSLCKVERFGKLCEVGRFGKCQWCKERFEPSDFAQLFQGTNHLIWLRNVQFFHDIQSFHECVIWSDHITYCDHPGIWHIRGCVITYRNPLKQSRFFQKKNAMQQYVARMMSVYLKKWTERWQSQYIWWSSMYFPDLRESSMYFPGLREHVCKDVVESVGGGVSIDRPCTSSNTIISSVPTYIVKLNQYVHQNTK